MSGIPGDEPKARVCSASEVTTGNLQVAAVDVALMKRYRTVDGHLFGGATTLGVIALL